MYQVDTILHIQIQAMQRELELDYMKYESACRDEGAVVAFWAVAREMWVQALCRRSGHADHVRCTEKVCRRCEGDGEGLGMRTELYPIALHAVTAKGFGWREVRVRGRWVWG
jgi:hypothetical protein